MKTMRQLCEAARDIQSAEDLSSVVHSFSKAIIDLRDLLRSQGKTITERTIQQHPVSVLYASKIAALTSCEFGTTFDEAFAESEGLIRAEVKTTYYYVYDTGATFTIQAESDAAAMKALAPSIADGKISTLYCMYDNLNRRTLYNYS